MSKKTRLTVITPVEITDNEAVTRQEWQPVGKIISATILPVTQEMAFKYHGYIKKVEFRVFYKGKNPYILVGNGIMLEGTPLKIVSTLPYGKVIDFLVANPDES